MRDILDALRVPDRESSDLGEAINVVNGFRSFCFRLESRSS